MQRITNASSMLSKLLIPALISSPCYFGKVILVHPACLEKKYIKPCLSITASLKSNKQTRSNWRGGFSAAASWISDKSLIRDFSLKTWNMWRRGARDIKEAVSNNLRVEWDINPRNKRQFGNIRKLGIDRSRDVVDDDVDDVDFWQTDPAFVPANSCWNARLIAP